MKKVLKAGLLLVIVLALVTVLTGCGDNVLTATKTTEESGMKMEEKMEITFDSNDKVEKVVETMTFDDEATAQLMASLFSLSDEEGIEVKQDGKSLVMTLDAKAFAEQDGMEEEDMSKEAIKKSLEDAGYTVK